MTDSTANRPTLHIAGALHVDEVATVQGRFTPAASNPVLWQRYIGGVGSNAARAAQSVLRSKDTNGSVSLHAALGDDKTAQSLVASLQNEGVQVSAQFVEGEATGRYSVVVDDAGHMVLGLADVQLAEKLQAQTLLALFDPALAGALMLDANLSAPCLKALIEYANKNAIPVAALTVSPTKALRLLPWAEHINLLFCNRREALSLARASHLLPDSGSAIELPLSTLARALIDIGFNDFVLTDAGAALSIRCRDKLCAIPIPPVAINHNVNGAGDSLAGATLAAVTLGFSLETAVSEFGLPMAADVLTGRHLPLDVQ